MLYTVKAISPVVDMLVSSGARTATKFVSPKLRVRASIKRVRGRVPVKGPFEIVVAIGGPNNVERKFVKRLLKAGEPFPVRKVQLKFEPKRKRARR